MRLQYLKIDNFKNLVDFSIQFDEASQDPITVILGRNGAGKSNLYEALVIIFRDLLTGRSTKEFAYDLRYTTLNGRRKIRVTNPTTPAEYSVSRSKPVFVSKEGAEVEAFSFSVTEDGQEHKVPKDRIAAYLPRYVVTYYSGPSDRLARHFFKPQLAFRDELLEGRSLPLRPMFYAKPIHSQFALLAFFMTEDKEAVAFLRNYLWIEGLESALFVLRRPHWASISRRRKGGDPRFWGARGVVRDFLSELYECALAPLKLPGTLQETFDKIERTEFMYLFLRDIDALRELAKRSLKIAKDKAQEPGRSDGDARTVKATDFFKILESTFMSDLIHETRIRVTVRTSGGLTFRELSEGEQQMLAVVGMLRFVRDDDSLFLLDEPDTHLNPTWGIEYLNILKQHADVGANSHLLLATHDPLVLANLHRDQIQMLERDYESGRISSSAPEEDPVGMGVQGILRNLFGLRSAIGSDTQAKLDRHAQLLALEDHRSADEDQEFALISDELDRAGYGREFRDPTYTAFVRALSRRAEFQKPDLTSDELKLQDDVADGILDDILTKTAGRE